MLLTCRCAAYDQDCSCHELIHSLSASSKIFIVFHHFLLDTRQNWLQRTVLQKQKPPESVSHSPRPAIVDQRRPDKPAYYLSTWYLTLAGRNCFYEYARTRSVIFISAFETSNLKPSPLRRGRSGFEAYFDASVALQCLEWLIERPQTLEPVG